MQTFISETIDDILLKHSSFEDCVFVLPSQRAGVFVKDTFKNKIVEGFLPEILTIESFIGQISEISKADAIQLLFHFYTIYCEVEEHPDSFDVFSKGKKVKNPQTGMYIELPGKKAGIIQVDYLGGDNPQNEFSIVSFVNGDIPKNNLTKYYIKEILR